MKSLMLDRCPHPWAMDIQPTTSSFLLLAVMASNPPAIASNLATHIFLAYGHPWALRDDILSFDVPTTSPDPLLLFPPLSHLPSPCLSVCRPRNSHACAAQRPRWRPRRPRSRSPAPEKRRRLGGLRRSADRRSPRRVERNRGLG